MQRVRVAAGVLQRANGEILLAQRPEGKIAAGRWEFPGGKIEAGESAEQALKRELLEEIGIDMRQARPLLRLNHAYSERIVELDTWLVTDWRGEPQSLEQQALVWCQPGATGDYDLLEADKPILDALQLPAELPVTGCFSSAEELLQKSETIFQAGHRLLRYRASHLNDQAYAAHLPALADLAAGHEAGLIVDRISALGCGQAYAGLQLRSVDLAVHDARPVGAEQWLLASVHGVEDIQRAQQLGANALVLGHVLPTSSHAGEAHLGWQGFSELAAQAKVPVYAIGGLGSDDMQAAWQAGAQGVAGISAYW